MSPNELAQGVNIFFSLFHDVYNPNKDIFSAIFCQKVDDNFENTYGYHGGRGTAFMFEFFDQNSFQKIQSHYCLGDKCQGRGCKKENYEEKVLQ